MRAREGKRTMRAQTPKADGVYVGDAQARPAPDGYVRRSPVQSIREAPDYRSKRRKKAIGTCVLLALLIAVAALLLKRFF